MHLVITGPTGSGKTKLAVEHAKTTGQKIINCDLFQFYKEVPVLSNQPKKQQDCFLYVAFKDMSETVTARQFSELVFEELQTPRILVGTGLTLGGVLYGFDEKQTRGTPFQGKPRFSYRMTVLNPPRDQLYEQINQRVDDMIENGAVEEARKIKEAHEKGWIQQNHPALKTIGLAELLAWLKGEVSKEAAIEKWKQSTRNLAKRQWTWLRKFCPPSELCEWKNPKPSI